MEWKQQYFIWNHPCSFERGTGTGIQVTRQGLTGCGLYFTRVCDSRREGMEWDRLFLEGECTSSAALQITVYTCDEAWISYQGRRISLQALIQDMECPLEEKEQVFQRFRRKELAYGSNQLLHGVTGRFLWMGIRLRPQDAETILLRRIQVFFPKMSWTAYLPEIYQDGQNTFLERFLEIFQTLYQEMNQRIEELPGLYSPTQTPQEWLVWLSRWISLEDPYLWQEQQLRYLIQHGMELSGLRGTAEYLKRILKLYTGTLPYVVEYCQWAYEEMNTGRRRVMECLYGENDYCVTVLLTEAEGDQRRFSVLERLLRHCCPAHMDIRMEILQPYIFLDRHSYLGINSQLGIMGEAVLDGQRFLPLVVLKEKENQNEG